MKDNTKICDDCIYFANGKGSERCDTCELTGTNKVTSLSKSEAKAYLQKELDSAYERKEKVGMPEKTRYIKALEVAISVLDGKYDEQLPEPHGRLIDADVLLDKIHEQMAQRIKWSMDSKDELSVKEICKAIDNTPTWK